MIIGLRFGVPDFGPVRHFGNDLFASFNRGKLGRFGGFLGVGVVNAVDLVKVKNGVVSQNRVTINNDSVAVVVLAFFVNPFPENNRRTMRTFFNTSASNATFGSWRMV